MIGAPSLPLRVLTAWAKAAFSLLLTPDHQRHITREATKEIKHDGFRTLAYIQNGECDLVSRNGNTFRNFKDLAQWIGENFRVESAVIDGEIVCVDEHGRSVFNDLLFRRRECLL